jgi:hypothetical protein
MLAHTFRGTTWRSLLGLESSRATFGRYCAIRRREREYLDWPDPLAGNSLPDAPSPSEAFAMPVAVQIPARGKLSRREANQGV